jgi:hypothetical protein
LVFEEADGELAGATAAGVFDWVLAGGCAAFCAGAAGELAGALLAGYFEAEGAEGNCEESCARTAPTIETSRKRMKIFFMKTQL